jgi:hypothetical protein
MLLASGNFMLSFHHVYPVCRPVARPITSNEKKSIMSCLFGRTGFICCRKSGEPFLQILRYIQTAPKTSPAAQSQRRLSVRVNVMAPEKIVGILPYLIKSQSIIALHYRTALLQSIACIIACNIALRLDRHRETDTNFYTIDPERPQILCSVYIGNINSCDLDAEQGKEALYLIYCDWYHFL